MPRWTIVPPAVLLAVGLLGLGVVLTRSVVQSARFLAEEERLDKAD